MKKKILTALLAVTVFSLTACTAAQEMRGTYQGGENNSGENNGGDGGDDYSNVELPEDEIMILSHNTNGAWIIEDNGIFVYTDGTAYGFDFDKKDYNWYDFDDYIREDRRYELIRQYVGPGSFYEQDNGRIYLSGIDEDILKQFYFYGKAIDPEAGFNEQQAGCDMGQSTLYFSDNGYNIKICSYGDMDYSPKDKNAQKFEKLWRDDKVIGRDVIKAVHIYDGSEYPLCNPEWGYDPDHEGSHIFWSVNDLEEFSADTDWDLMEIFDLMDEYHDPDQYIYLVQIENVNSGGYDLKNSGVIFYKDHIDLIPSEKNTMPSNTDVVTMAMDGFCTVMAIPTEFFDSSIKQFYHFDGTPWTVHWPVN